MKAATSLGVAAGAAWRAAGCRREENKFFLMFGTGRLAEPDRKLLLQLPHQLQALHTSSGEGGQVRVKGNLF